MKIETRKKAVCETIHFATDEITLVKDGTGRLVERWRCLSEGAKYEASKFRSGRAGRYVYFEVTQYV